ncbi:TonB-dependent receptor [Paracidobacterium acidisoli]|uniref:TonB-dependent transporter Oar-like beta-barrel domain-containing protein n=1 Tax=Paracidobacterium acidisoli TaxID=2303751 RepID=A0A372ILM1_9BACT|nr:TonB-dependent receptor [Paracidobacterium acidisoli]MBT9332434.1 TonB-dependent receptor [Paracidobacterium acidisoli]
MVRKIATLLREAHTGFVILCLLLTAPFVQAQIRSGTITGSVTDPSGAIVVDAGVTVTDTGTNATYTTKTTSSGSYTVPYLETGTYSVSITHSGFVTFSETGLQLNPSQTARVDAVLQIGAASTKVEVHALAEQLQTDSSTVSAGVDSLVIDSIPNVTENPLYYATLQNGVQPRNEASTSQTLNSFGIGVAGRAQFSAIGVNGGRAFENDIQLDGLPIMGDGFNEASIIPNEEGIQEVRVISNDFDAQYGRGQAVMSITTKSGTNEFHGQASYMIRNEALNANTWGNNDQNISRKAFKVNDFGGAVTGPIKRNSIFFSSSYHLLRFNQGQTYLETVPTALERVGNFSNTFQQDANGAAQPAQIFNPFSVTQLGPDLYQRAPFPNAIIPNPNPEAVYMYSFYPTPNRTPDDVYNTNNFTSTVVNTVRRQTLNNRIDYKRGIHSIYGSGGFDFGTILQPNAFGTAGFNNDPATTKDRNPYAQIGDTIVLSPTLFVDVRYGATRTDTINFAGNHSGFTQYDKFGIPSATQSLFAEPGAAPVVNPNGFGGSTGGSNWAALSGGQFANKQEHQISHAINGSVTKVHGNWTFKEGAEYRVILANYTDFEEGSANIGGCCAGDPGGNYTFEYATAEGKVAPGNTSPLESGMSGATMLVGEGVWFVRPGANLKPAYAAKYFGIYSQNDWQVRPGLTLNLGLRWDVQPGVTERYNRMSGIDFTKKNAFGTMGAIDFPGTMGYSRNLWDTEYHDFQPRLGAAWQVRPGTVVRAGFGITYLPSNTGYFSSPNDYGEAPFAPGNQALPYGSNPHGVPVTQFTDPSPLVVATGSNASAPQIYGTGEALFDRHLKNQIAKQGNVFIEQAFGGRSQWLFSLGWSGSWSDHLTTRNLPFEDLQSLPAATLAGWKNQYIASNGATDPSSVQVANPYQPATGPLTPFQGSLAARTIEQFIPLLPYPHLYGAGLNGSTGFARYNSLQVRLNHAFSSGLHLDLNYTWGKELDFTTTGIEDGQGVNYGGNTGTPDLVDNRLNQNYGLADLPHRFVATLVYESPFGSKGHFTLSNAVARQVLGDWSLGSVVTAQDGMPFVISMSNAGSITSRVDRVPGQPLQVPKGLQHWYNGSTTVTLPCGKTVTPQKYTFLKYNACAFTGETLTTPDGSIHPNLYWNGDAAQTSGGLRGPGRFNVDFSLRRSFPVTERISLQVSAEASNLLNHAEFNGSYTGSLGSPNLVNNPGGGLIPGLGTSSTYGTLGVTTFDPRQITMHARVVF